MDLSNMFIIVSILTLFFSILVGIYSLAVSFFRKSSISFFILSIITAIISLSTIHTLNIKDYASALPWAYVLTAGVFLFPAVTLHFITNLLQNDLSKINKYFKILFYLPPAGIILYFVLGRNIFMVSTRHGYLSNLAGYLNFGFAYLLPYWLVTTALISFQIYKNHKRRKSNLSAIIMLLGVGFYILGNGIYHPLSGAGLVERFPANSFLMFFFYFFVTISIIILEFNIENIALRNIFEYVQDCILITNRDGDIKEINRSMYNLLFEKPEDFNPRRINPKKVKSLIFKKMSNRRIARRFFADLKESNCLEANYNVKFTSTGEDRVFDVSLSPIIDKNKKIYGKLAIFRDITEYQILHEKLKEQAEIDFLTGIYNRRYLHNRLNQEIKRFHRSKQPLSMLIIDIDNFKKYNDKYGHLKGDWLLKEVARIIKRNIRDEVDIAARFGGDEFAVILINTDLDKAREITSRIIGDYKSTIKKSKTSLSIGVAQYKKTMEMDSFIKKTDLLMYESKKLECDSKPG